MRIEVEPVFGALTLKDWKEVREMEKEKEIKDLPKYEAPKVVTYHEDDIFEELGPAQACTSPCPVP